MKLLLAAVLLLPASARLQGDGASPVVVHLPEEGVEVPLDNFGGRPVVEVAVYGEEPLRLLLDTGSTYPLILDATAWTRFGLAGDPAVDSGSGHVVGRLPELFLGDARFENVPALRMSEVLPGSDVHGILGFPLFAGCLLTLDFPGKTLRLDGGKLEKGADTVAFRHDEKMGFGIVLDLDVAGVSVPVHLDTGSPELVLFSSLVQPELPLAAAPRPAGRAQTPMGGADISTAPLKGDLRLGPLVFHDPQVRFGDLPQIAGRRLGNVGSRFVAGLRLTIDSASLRIRIQTPSATPPPGAVQAKPGTGTGGKG